MCGRPAAQHSCSCSNASFDSMPIKLDSIWPNALSRFAWRADNFASAAANAAIASVSVNACAGSVLERRMRRISTGGESPRGVLERSPLGLEPHTTSAALSCVASTFATARGVSCGDDAPSWPPSNATASSTDVDASLLCVASDRGVRAACSLASSAVLAPASRNRSTIHGRRWEPSSTEAVGAFASVTKAKRDDKVRPVRPRTSLAVI